MGEITPVVSVVIAARDAATQLPAQLGALAAQTVDVPWELLVCDNGSTDGTADVARSWVGRIPSVRVLDASGARGAGGARNLGVDAAHGALVAFCDADDVVDGGWLQAIVDGMVGRDFAGCRWEMTRLNPRWGGAATQGPTFRMGTLPHLAFAGAGAMAVRRAVFVEVGGFDVSLPIGEDVDLSWRIQLSGTPLVGLDDAVVHIRERDGLRAMVRQWYRFGKAEKQLRARFAAVPVTAGANADAVTGPSLPPAGAGLRDSLGRKWRKLWQMRSWRDVTPFLQRRARALGLRWGRIDASVAVYRGPGSVAR